MAFYIIIFPIYYLIVYRNILISNNCVPQKGKNIYYFILKNKKKKKKKKKKKITMISTTVLMTIHIIMSLLIKIKYIN